MAAAIPKPAPKPDKPEGEEEAGDEEAPTGKIVTNVTWMPMSRELTVPLAALSVCNVNLEPNCDFHVSRKYESYLDSWRHPAPAHCQPGGKLPSAPVVHADRLGIIMGGPNCR